MLYMDDKMYDDMIVDAPVDGKPWFVLFGKTPYSN